MDTHAEVTTTTPPRIDEETGLGSIIDSIRLTNSNLSSGNASNALQRLIASKNQLTTPSATLTTESSQLSELIASIKLRIKTIVVNGKGAPTPCTDARTMMEILWLLPGAAADRFRAKSASTICRFLGGDLELAEECRQRCLALQATPEGRQQQAFLLGARLDDEDDELTVDATAIVPSVVTLETPDWIHVAKRSDLEDTAGLVLREDGRIKRLKTTHLALETLERVVATGLGEEEKRQISAFVLSILADPPITQTAEATSAAMCQIPARMMGFPKDDPQAATSDVSPLYRGPIVTVEERIRTLAYPIKSIAKVNNAMLKAYESRYGNYALERVPRDEDKRPVWYARDIDLMDRAIRESK